MKVWLYTFASVMVVSLISLVGIFTLSLKKERLENILLFLVSFAIGGLFGDAFIHLIPESFEKLGIKLVTSLCVLGGILLFFVLEKFLRWHHCHLAVPGECAHPVVTLNLVGDGVHNLIDGMIIGASFLVSIPIGITTSLAVVSHELPQEIGDFGILVHGGLSARKALLFNFLSALVAFIGAAVSLLLGPQWEGYSTHLLPITAGGFIYIAGSDLIPELQQGCDVRVSTPVWQFICMSIGVGIMALLSLLG